MDELQSMLDVIAETARRNRTNIRLGRFIDSLKGFDPEHKVYFGFIPEPYFHPSDDVAERLNDEISSIKDDFALDTVTDSKLTRDGKIWALDGNSESYRGYYEDMELTYGAMDIDYAFGAKIPKVDGNSFSVTAGHLVSDLTSKLGTTMIGYKGGEYTITEDTVPWISNYGHCSDIRPLSLVDDGHRVTILCDISED